MKTPNNIHEVLLMLLKEIPLEKKKEVASYRLSKEFLHAEREFINSFARKMAEDKDVIKALVNWDSMDEVQRKDFASEFTKKLGKHCHIKNVKTDFCIEADENHDGKHKYENKYHILELRKNITDFEAWDLMGIVVHELAGHGRQAKKDYGSKRPGRDTELLKKQSRGYYVRLDEDEKIYESQPAEIHANYLKNCFLITLARALQDGLINELNHDRSTPTKIITMEESITEAINWGNNNHQKESQER